MPTPVHFPLLFAEKNPQTGGAGWGYTLGNHRISLFPSNTMFSLQRRGERSTQSHRQLIIFVPVAHPSLHPFGIRGPGVQGVTGPVLGMENMQAKGGSFKRAQGQDNVLWTHGGVGPKDGSSNLNFIP